MTIPWLGRKVELNAHNALIGSDGVHIASCFKRHHIKPKEARQYTGPLRLFVTQIDRIPVEPV